MRTYTVGGANIAVTNGATTIVLINPPTGRSIKIIEAWAEQAGTTASAQYEMQLGTKASAFPTLTSATPRKLNASDPVSYITGGTAGAAGTCGINASAEGAGTFTEIMSSVFNNLIGFRWTAQESLRNYMTFSSADSLAFAMKFRAAPGSLTAWSFGVTYQEIG